MTQEAVLQFKDLDVKFKTEFGRVHAVKGLNLKVHPGEVVALVGESGSGKSVTATTALGLLPKNASLGGETIVGPHSISKLNGKQLRNIRGSHVAMVFQEPMTALNPVIRVGEQLTEAMEVHGVAFGREAWARAVDLLKAVGIPNAERRAKQFPHELSGGMRQRVVIAMALSCDPEVIIADEPTTALDVTVQADILDLLRSLKDKLNTGILLITHNMGVVADMADRVAVMFKGDIVEHGTSEEVLLNPQHPYTKRLLDAVPHLGDGHGQFGEAVNPVTTEELALDVQDFVIEYKRQGKKPFRAVDGVSFDVRRGEIVGLVGESGSGKSTVGRALLGLIQAHSGEVRVLGEDLTKLRGPELKKLRRRIGVIFQDPAASLNPRLPVGDVIAEPLDVHRIGTPTERKARVHELLDAVRLPRSAYNRYPHELSGGQRQRVSIARALTINPDLLIADEPTSALDVSVQASVLEMFTELQKEFGFACLFISHDLAVIDSLAHRVVVVIECTPAVARALDHVGLFEDFPHRVGSVREDAGGTMILARQPLREIERLDTTFDNILVGTSIGGVDWRIAGIHVVPPHYRADQWAEDGRKIRDLVDRHDDAPLLLAGDFNAIEQHHIMRELDGLTNAMAGPPGTDAWRPTWPVHDVIPLFARIDHVLHSEHVTMPRPVTFEISGTGHLGLVVHPAAS